MKLLTILLLAIAARADTLNITTARITCNNRSGWETGAVYGDGFFAGVGDDGGCLSGNSYVIDFSLFSLYKEIDNSWGQFFNVTLEGFLGVSGPDPTMPKVESGTVEVTSPVIWNVSGIGSLDDLGVGFDFNGSGTGIGYFDYSPTGLDSVTWYLTDPPRAFASNPEPSGVWLLGSALVALVIAWIGVKRG